MIIVSLSLYKPLGIAGLVIGTLVANMVMTTLLWPGARGSASTEAFEGARTTMITVRVCTASALLAGVSYAVWHLLDALFGTSLPAQIVSVGGAALAGLWVYSRAVLIMSVPEAHQVHRLIMAQLGRA